MPSVVRTYRTLVGTPRLLGLSFLLAALGLCLRADTPLLLALGRNGGAWPFELALLAGACVAAVVAWRMAGARESRAAKAFAAVCAVAGSLAALIAGLPFAATGLVGPCLAAVAGLLPGCSFSAGAVAWGCRYRRLGGASVLGCVSLSLLLSSVWWWVASLFQGAGLAACFVGVYCVAGVLLAGPGASCADRHSASACGPVPSEALPARRVAALLWAPWSIMLFSFFTLGLTFWPQNYGGDGLPWFSFFFSPKIVAYALVVLVAWWFLGRNGRDDALDADAALFCRLSLPIAAAVMLASPFADHVVPFSGTFAFSVASYVGIALCNTAGIAAMLSFGGLSGGVEGRRSVGVLSSFAASCALAMGAGMLVFQLLDANAQVVSLCLLAVYLVALVLSGIREEVKAPQAAPPAFDDTCERLAQRYGLSARESEILPYLARGRGAKAVAEKLHISPETVRTHSKRIYEKMGVHTREELLDLIEDAE